MNNHQSTHVNKQHSMQLLNTAIIKSKEKKIDSSYEDRLNSICESKAVEALGVAAKYLAESQNTSHDQAMIQLIETVRSLDSIWTDYVMMEGLSKLKDLLGGDQTNH